MTVLLYILAGACAACVVTCYAVIWLAALTDAERMRLSDTPVVREIGR